MRTTKFSCILVVTLQLYSLLGCKSAGSNVVSVSASVDELPKGYLKWLHTHPKLAQAPEGGSSEGGTYEINWPLLNIYTPDGGLLFHGEDSRNNIRVLDDLPRTLPRRGEGQPTWNQPILSEAEAMFPELAAKGKLPKSAGIYTVFVIKSPWSPDWLCSRLRCAETKDENSWDEYSSHRGALKGRGLN